MARSKRVESERFRHFSYDDLIDRGKANLDDASTLPAPGVLATEIIEELEAALTQFSELGVS